MLVFNEPFKPSKTSYWILFTLNKLFDSCIKSALVLSIEASDNFSPVMLLFSKFVELTLISFEKHRIFHKV